VSEPTPPRTGPTPPFRQSRTLPRFSGDERVEARLLEFLEGELPAAEAAEIEAHLSRNPHQRQLLAELAATRAAVAGLPQGPAPLEIYDAVQARLERSALLDEPTAQHTAKATRPRLLPQVLAVGGITAAAAALAWVVVLVVSPSKVPEPAVVAMVPAPGPVAAPEVVFAPRVDKPGPLASVSPNMTDRIAAPAVRPSVEARPMEKTGVPLQNNAAALSYNAILQREASNKQSAEDRSRGGLAGVLVIGGWGPGTYLVPAKATPTTQGIVELGVMARTESDGATSKPVSGAPATRP
jgi:hypothetical protein